MAEIRSLGVPGVFTDGRDLLTENLVPGRSVYGERLVPQGGVEYRAWDPTRSKLAALLRKGWRGSPFRDATTVLYLGAATGTTVSHVSDICSEGTVFAVEVSRRAFQKLVDLSEARRNVFPVLADASKPESYAGVVGSVDVVYQDIAQRDQPDILARNLRLLRPAGTAILIVKARSADVAREPDAVYRDAASRLRSEGLRISANVPLEPFQKDHAAIVAERGG